MNTTGDTDAVVTVTLTPKDTMDPLLAAHLNRHGPQFRIPLYNKAITGDSVEGYVVSAVRDNWMWFVPLADVTVTYVPGDTQQLFVTGSPLSFEGLPPL